MASAAEGNVFGEMKDRWINPLYTEGVGRRTGRQLHINAGRDSEGFENFSDYWSDSAADSDISELLGKENDTSHVVADGREGRYTDAANRKLSSPLKAMQSFSSVSTKSSDPSTSGGITGHISTGSTIGSRTRLSSAGTVSTEHTGEQTSADQQNTEQITEDMTETDHQATEDITETDHQAIIEEDPSQDLDVSGHVNKTGDGAVTEPTTPLQESINEADVTGSIIAVRVTQAPNSALQVFKTKKRLSFSGNEFEDKSAKKKTPSKGEKCQSSLGKTSVVRKSPRHTRPTTESSTAEEDEDLDTTLTGSSKSDSETPTKGKGSSEESDDAKEDATTKSDLPTRRSTRSKSTVDSGNMEGQEHQERNSSEEEGLAKEEDDHQKADDEMHKNEMENSPNKTATLSAIKPTEQFEDNIDDSANASRFLTLQKSHLQTLLPTDNSGNDEDVEMGAEIEIVEETKVVTRRNTKRRESKVTGKKKVTRRKGRKGKAQKDDEEDDEKSSGNQTSPDSSNSPVDQKENKETDSQETEKETQDAANTNQKTSGAGEKGKDTRRKQRGKNSSKEETQDGDDESDGKRISRSQRGKQISVASKGNGSEKDEEQNAQEDEMATRPLRISRRSTKGHSKSARLLQEKQQSAISDKQNKEVEMEEKMEEESQEQVDQEEVDVVPAKKSRRGTTRSQKSVEAENKITETTSGRGRTRKGKKGSKNNKSTDDSKNTTSEENDADNVDEYSITTQSIPPATSVDDEEEHQEPANDEETNVENTSTQSTTAKVFELVQLAESMEQSSVTVGEESVIASKSQTSSNESEDVDIVTVKKNATFCSRVESGAEIDEGTGDTSDIVINVNSNKNRMSWQKTPSQLSPIKIDSYLEDYVSRDMVKDKDAEKKTSKAKKKKQTKADKRSKASKKTKRKGKKSNKEAETMSADQAGSSSSQDESEQEMSSAKKRKQQTQNKGSSETEEEQEPKKQRRPSKRSTEEDEKKTKRKEKKSNKEDETMAADQTGSSSSRDESEQEMSSAHKRKQPKQSKVSSETEEEQEPKRQRRPSKRSTEEDEEEEPVRKIQKPTTKQQGRKRQSPGSRKSSSSSEEISKKRPTPKSKSNKKQLPDNSVYSYGDMETSADTFDSDNSHGAPNTSGANLEDSRRASCVMKMGRSGTTVVTVHAQSEPEPDTEESDMEEPDTEEHEEPHTEEQEEPDTEEDERSTPPVTSAEPTPKSILKKTGKKGSLQNRRLTLKFFDVPKKKGYIVKPEAVTGLRRTGRTRCQTLDYWRNERPLYERRKSGGFALVGIKSPTNAKTPDARKTKPRTMKKRMIAAGQTTPGNVSMHVTPPPKAKPIPHTAVTVLNPETKEEVEVDAVITSDMHHYVGPSGKVAEPEDPISVCKCLHQQAFSSGILKVRGLKEKSKQLVRRNTMVFYIIHGKLSVSIHNTTQILQTGDTFFVPQGNVYSIQNLRKDEAKLKFFQLKNG